MGRRVVHCGGAGLGQAAKVCNNMILGISQIAVAEAFVLGERLGLSHQALFDVASNASGQCWALTTNCPVPGPGAHEPREPRLPARLRRRAHVEGPRARRAGDRPDRCRRPDGPPRARDLQGVRGRRRRRAGFLGDHQHDPRREREPDAAEPAAMRRANDDDAVRDDPGRDARSRRVDHPEPARGAQRAEHAGDARHRGRGIRLRRRSRASGRSSSPARSARSRPAPTSRRWSPSRGSTWSWATTSAAGRGSPPCGPR